LLAASAWGALLKILAMLTKPIFTSAAWARETGNAKAAAINTLRTSFNVHTSISRIVRDIAPIQKINHNIWH